MKASKILAVLFLCSIVHLSKGYAQKDYIITKNHDTVFCSIMPEFGIHSEYKINGEKKYHIIEHRDGNSILYSERQFCLVIENFTLNKTKKNCQTRICSGIC